MHKYIFQCTNVILSAQMYFHWTNVFSVHKCISQCANIFTQCTNIFLSAQMYFSVHKCISQYTNLFLSARQISVHKSCLNEKCNLSVCMQSFLSEFLQVSYFLVSLFSSVGGHICSSWAIQDSFLLLRRKRDSKVSRLSLALGHCYSGVSTI